MKKYLQLFSLLAIFGGAILVFGQCKKETDDDDKKPDTTAQTDKMYNKWWYPVATYGDFYFDKNGTYQYQFFSTLINGTYTWYNKDSMRLIEETGGEWTAWFRTISEKEFTMSRGNEDHLNVYTYKDVKPTTK